MKWEKIKKEMEKADRIIERSRKFNTNFYIKQRLYWMGFKRGAGFVFNLFKGERQEAVSEQPGNKELPIDFLVRLVGQDKETIEQMFSDWERM